jgi:hypothetical protein
LKDKFRKTEIAELGRPVDRGQARRAEDGSTRSEIDLPTRPEEEEAEAPKQ